MEINVELFCKWHGGQKVLKVTVNIAREHYTVSAKVICIHTTEASKGGAIVNFE